MDKILLGGLTFFGRHGCLAAERELGQKFLVDIELECDLQRAAATDDLHDTVDYIALYRHAQLVIEGPSAHLLEHLAAQIGDFALKDPRVQLARVRLRKPHVAVPVALDFLGVEIERRRPSA